jgi:hypothetical protein
MTKARKIFLWITAGAGILLALLIAVAAIVPSVLDTAAIGRSLATELETRYHVHCERIKVILLPFPRVVLGGVRITIPETVTAFVDAAVIHPKILPLFRGKFTPDEVELLRPVITARLPEQTSAATAEPVLKLLLRLKEKISRFQPVLLAMIPGMVVDAGNCRLEFYCGQDRVFFFEDIDLRGSVHTQRVDFELTSGKSNLWQALALNGWIDLGTLKGSADLSLTGGNPGDMLRYFKIPEFSKSDSQVDLTVAVSTSGFESLHADFKASVPRFDLGDVETGRGNGETGSRAAGIIRESPSDARPDGRARAPSSGSERQQDVVMTNGAIAGTLNIDRSGMDISIPQFLFDYPRLNLTASFIEKFYDQSVALDIKGRETDVASVRSFVQIFDKGNPISRRVFEIIRDGEAPSILFSAHADKASNLTEFASFSLKGSIENGVVFAPKADLLVSNVAGNIAVEDGVLVATDLSGRTGGSSTGNGELRIGLRLEDTTFHLDLPITADLSELPDVLNRVVANKAFRQELAQIKDVAGKARGRLILDEGVHPLTVKVESGPFQLFCRYAGLPQPVDLKGASFLMEGRKLSAASLAGNVGSSSFEQMDLSWDWGEANVLEIGSPARSTISMELLSPSLKAHHFWKNFVDTAPKGSLAIDSFHFIGPPADRSKWIINARGAIEEIVSYNKRLNGPLILKNGAFEIEEDQIVLKGVDAILADSSLSVSGVISGFLDSARKVDLQLSGKLGPEGNKVAASLAGFPDSLRALSTLDLLSSRLTWNKEQKTTFKGEMDLSAGTHVKVDLVKTPKEFSIVDLTIKDEDSDTTISMDSSHGRLKVGFSGKLSNKTADRLLVDNSLLTGPVAGKFIASLFLDAPEKSSAQGEVRIAGFKAPVGNLAAAARIESAEIEADGNKLNVKSAMVSWNENRVSLAGNISFTGNAFLVDMDALADSFDLESVLQKTEVGGQNTGSEAQNAEEGGPKTEGDLTQDVPQSLAKALGAPVRGLIRVRSEHLSYGKLTWEPANADVVFSPESVDIRVNQANLCGISNTGSVRIAPEGLKVSIGLSAKDRDIEPALSCLLKAKHIISGKYSLNGSLSAKDGGKGGIMDNLEGDVVIEAKDGRIFGFNTFGKIVSLLSVSEIYRGVLPDLGEGCAFKSITAKGKIKNGKLNLTDAVVNGPCIKMVVRGEIDFTRDKVDMIAMVVPQRTVERIVDATPIVGKVLDDALVTVPFRVEGDWTDPTVIPLPPSAVGEELLGVVKRVFKLPFSVFQPGGDSAKSER